MKICILCIFQKCFHEVYNFVKTRTKNEKHSRVTKYLELAIFTLYIERYQRHFIFYKLFLFICYRTGGGSMLGDVNISAILDSFSVSYDKRVRPNYGGK